MHSLDSPRRSALIQPAVPSGHHKSRIHLAAFIETERAKERRSVILGHHPRADASHLSLLTQTQHHETQRAMNSTADKGHGLAVREPH